MTGYRIKQTAFILIGFSVGLWAGNFAWHACARYTADQYLRGTGNYPDETSPKYVEYQNIMVGGMTEHFEKSWSEYNFQNLVRDLFIYGATCAIGASLGRAVAKWTGGEND